MSSVDRFGYSEATTRTMEAQQQAEPVAYPLRKFLPDMERQALDKAVTAMAAKLYQKYLEGYGGFEDCSEQTLNAMLHEHVGKGDPIDIANFAAFLHFNGQRVTKSPNITTEQVEQIKRLAVRCQMKGSPNDFDALHAALDALVAKGE